MGTTVQIPMNLEGVVYRTMQKLAKAVLDCTVLNEKATGTISKPADSYTPGTKPGVIDSFAIYTGYIPTDIERPASYYRAKIYNFEGTFDGDFGFECIPLKNADSGEIVIAVNIWGDGSSSYSDYTADWVLHELK
jgi:hypothetical protein